MRAVFIGLVGLVLAVGASQAKDEDEINWCGKLLSRSKCVHEIIRVEKILKEFDDEENRAGRMLYNRGNSLVGCGIHCARRYVSYDEDEEKFEGPCSYKTSALKRFEAADPRLRKARVLTYIKGKCSRKPD